MSESRPDESPRAHVESRPPESSPSRFVSGFGTLVEKETTLQASTIECMSGLGTTEGFNVDRILRAHHKNISEVIQLLRERFYLLPKPDRFTALYPGMEATHIRAAEGPAGQSPLEGLARAHAAIGECLEKLLVLDEDCVAGRRLLEQAVEQHAEMAWMLMALVHEDRTVAPDGGGAGGGASAGRKAPGAVDSWENEGGAGPSPSP